MRTRPGYIAAASIAAQLREATKDRESVDVVAAMRIFRRSLVSTGTISAAIATAVELEVDTIAEDFERATKRRAGG